MTVAPLGRSARLARNAAGFIATSTSGASPGVRMSWSAKWTWNDETPGSVPWGARISAGKLGSVDRSLPYDADSWVKRSPVSCMPSPESPANRMITRSSRLTCLDNCVHNLSSLGRCAPDLRGAVRSSAQLPHDSPAAGGFRLIRGICTVTSTTTRSPVQMRYFDDLPDNLNQTTLLTLII